MGLIEGFFTSIAASYYHRTFITTQILPLEYNLSEKEKLDEEKLDIIEKIDFDLRFIEKMKRELTRT